LKERESLQDKQQEKNTSYDYGLVTNSIKEIDPELYRSEKWVKSSSKVVFSGLGADEVWAGYSRYKTALLKNG
jgi:asparagine synthetase B (glutamine-hydrolysing)